MSSSWAHQLLPGRIIFGPGSVSRVPAECARLGGNRVFVIASGSAVQTASDLLDVLGDAASGLLGEVRQHIPAELVDRATKEVEGGGADLVVTVGGGSAVGLGKAVALRLGLPIVAVPTTYAGSEMTPIYGITSDGQKVTGRDERVLPKAVVYDPLLTVGLSPALTAASGMNAMAHCVEALWVPTATPLSNALALEGIRLLAAGLPVSVARPDDLDGRASSLTGACIAGHTLGTVGTGLHHKICHVLGGTFDLPHAEVHAVILPYVAAGQASASAPIEAVLPGEGSTAGRLQRLARRLGCPASLAALGLPESDLSKADPLIDAPDAAGILRAAWRGDEIQ
jgi:maleylacetate reductase